LIRNR